MSSGPYVFLSIEVYCYRPDENIEIPLNHLLLTVRYYNISLFIWEYNKALINRALGPIFVLTFKAHGPHCVRSICLQRQNKYRRLR